MSTAYFFRIGPLHFIINAQSSKIGFNYPRVFVRFPDNSYLNIDLSLPAMFVMSEDDWMSWLDGTQQDVDTIEEVRAIAKDNGFDWDKFEKEIFEFYKKADREN